MSSFESYQVSGSSNAILGKEGAAGLRFFPSLPSGPDGVPLSGVPNRNRCSLVEQDQIKGRARELPGCERRSPRLYVLARECVVHRDKFINGHSFFEILKDRCHWHACRLIPRTPRGRERATQHSPFRVRFPLPGIATSQALPWRFSPCNYTLGSLAFGLKPIPAALRPGFPPRGQSPAIAAPCLAVESGRTHCGRRSFRS